MSIFDAIKKTFSGQPSYTVSSVPGNLRPEEKALLSQIFAINRRGGELSPELYQRMRHFEMNWLERHYDFNTIEGINSIPVTPNLPGAPHAPSPLKGHTGEVYYYLRHKAYSHENAGNNELALACMRKSVALVMCRNFYSTDDCYPLVKMLARFGFADEAYSKKREIDKLFGISKIDDSIIEAELKRGQELLDFDWIQANIPDKCPKNITGYRRMKTQNTKNYQLLKQLAAEKGRSIQLLIRTIYTQISTLCAQHNITPGKLCSELGISRGIITDLKMGKKDLHATTAYKIAKYFGVSVGYLLGMEEK